ncbi:MAG: hypothetical protein U9Q80_03185 [Bacillota bacterium]|nr:hypothetical protein [Bacillota bacterium]
MSDLKTKEEKEQLFSGDEQISYIRKKMGDDYITEEDVDFVKHSLRIEKKSNTIELGGILNFIQIIAVIDLTILIVLFFRRDLAVLRLVGFTKAFPLMIMTLFSIGLILLILKINISREMKMRNILIGALVIMFAINIVKIYLGLIRINVSILAAPLLVLYYWKSKRVKYTFVEKK